MLQIKIVTASEIKIGDLIADPVLFKSLLTEDGLLSDEMADAFVQVIKVDVLRDIDIDKRNEILKEFPYSLDTVIFTVGFKDIIQFLPNETETVLYEPLDDITILLQEN